MQAPHTTRTGSESASSIRYADWRGRIQLATDIDQLVRIVREYLAAWTAAELAPIPLEVGASALSDSSDLSARAVLAAQAELSWKGDEAGGRLMREMALTLSAAASRLRFLTAMRSREATSGGRSSDS